MTRHIIEVWEVEHQGDELEALYELGSMGCTDVVVLHRDYQDQERLFVSVESPDADKLKAEIDRLELCMEVRA